MRPVFLVFISLLLFTINVAAKDDSTSTTSTIEIAASLRGIQIDGTVFLFTFAYGGSVDFDFLRFTEGRHSTLGLRGGVEYFETGGPGGRTGGSPYIDYNLLLRSTLAGESMRFDAFLGYAYHTSDIPNLYPSEGLVKYGVELRWKIAPSVFGLLAKAIGTKSAGVIGVGIYFGWDQ